ncbi:MAG: arginine--tRNA ligase [Nitrospina sp.]|jgi:arginyl-tRNA synthetase|nr:arginine--tRNA ligase [Nitrospina sp.]MBT3415012.1 arginine--tRNA ligase [Nitrospina sp.]MBT3857172.1 arginine--tRNA ligase [Nitrospina sp.]MBT4104453.1 arginine--tRNA ligase [Nitrospina sp.]MBT4389189.1 arginine--tRNA ligase [Nitrospina sp.]
MKTAIQTIIQDALEKARQAGELELSPFPEIVVEKPKDEKMGDFSTNVAMTMAKSERKNPKVIAESVARYLENGDLSQVEVAGPGFINLKMSHEFFLQRLKNAVKQGNDFGQSDVGQGTKVMIEFVSANPTGPLHVGHGRGAAVGDALARILRKAGYDLSTEYYINDVGNQMNFLGRSTWLRYRELLGEAIEFPDDHYRGEYIKDIANEIVEQKGDEFLKKPEEECLPFFRKYAKDTILKGIEKDLAEFRVTFDNWFSEQSLYEDNSVEKAIEWLKGKGHIYEKDGAVWLKSSAFDDDKDRVIVKQSGEKTYFCSDIAYHQNKIGRGFEKLVNLMGADHHGYVPRMEAVLEAMGYDKKIFKILLVQFVSLLRAGEKVSMSTRSGEFETLTDVVNEVGVDAARYYFLMRSSDTHLDFDLELAKKETPDNPVFYIQYAHARICSIFRTAEEKGVAWNRSDEVNLAPLVDEEEFAIIRAILAFPEVVEKSARAMEVHRISHYLLDMVSRFHGYYSRHRVVSDDKALTLARLFLLDAIRITIRNGFELMGISAPEKM